MKNKNENKNLNIKECPQCLGIGVTYMPNLEKDEKCTLCNGKGTVDNKIFNSFNPLEGLNIEIETNDEEYFENLH